MRVPDTESPRTGGGRRAFCVFCGSLSLSVLTSARADGSSGPGNPLAAMDAVQRLNAARKLESDAGNTWLWVGIGAAVIAVAVGATALMILRNKAAQKRSRAAFRRHSERCGLRDEEVGFIARLARLAAMRDISNIFTDQAAFERGATALRASGRFRELSAGDKQHIEGMIQVLREKLGFARQTVPSSALAEMRDEQQLGEGDEISLVHRGRPAGYTATVAEVTGREVVVEPQVPLDDVKPGETWLVRFPGGGMIWEFDTQVVRAVDGRYVLNRPERLRFINRRRFPRVRAKRPMRLAAFGGLRTGAGEPTVTFLAGTITELAGPGLLIDTTLESSVGQGVLVVLPLREDAVLEGLGKVRRVLTEKGRPQGLAVELVGLNPNEVAELVRATNAAAQKKRSGEEDKQGQGQQAAQSAT